MKKDEFFNSRLLAISTPRLKYAFSTVLDRSVYVLRMPCERLRLRVIDALSSYDWSQSIDQHCGL